MVAANTCGRGPLVTACEMSNMQLVYSDKLKIVIILTYYYSESLRWSDYLDYGT